MEGQKNPWKLKAIKDMKSHYKLKVIESQKNQWKQKEIKSNKKLNGMKSQIEIIMGNFKIWFLHKLGWTVNFHKNI